MASPDSRERRIGGFDGTERLECDGRPPTPAAHGHNVVATETGGVQTLIVFTLLSTRSVFPLAGFRSFDYATLAGSGGLTPEGFGAILPATALVFVSFRGYAKIATVAEELENPGRTLPTAIIATGAPAAQASFPSSIGPIGGIAAGAATILPVGSGYGVQHRSCRIR